MPRAVPIGCRTLFQYCLAISAAIRNTCVMLLKKMARTLPAPRWTITVAIMIFCGLVIKTNNVFTFTSQTQVQRSQRVLPSPVLTTTSPSSGGTTTPPVPVGNQSTTLHKLHEKEKGISPPEYLLPRNRTITPLNFPFLVTGKEICSKKRNPLLLIIALSQHENEARRSAIRKTWGRVARGKPWPGRFLCGYVSLVFLLGRHQNEALNTKVRKEAEVEQDIMMADFIDTYRNLTYKTLMGLKWMKKFCPGAKFIMKVDDDTFPNIPRIMNVVASIDMTFLTYTIFGPFSFGGKVNRDPNSRHYVGKSAYFPDSYPPHVKGVMYVIPNALALKIVNVSKYFPYVAIEDASVTGILANCFNVRYLNIPEDLYDRYPKGSQDDCEFALEKKLVAKSITPSVAVRLWNGIERRESCQHTYTAFFLKLGNVFSQR